MLTLQISSRHCRLHWTLRQSVQVPPKVYRTDFEGRACLMTAFLQLELEDLSTYGTLVDGEKKAGSRVPLTDGSRITLTHGRTLIVEFLPEPPPVTPWGARLQLKRPPVPAGTTGSVRCSTAA